MIFPVNWPLLYQAVWAATRDIEIPRPHLEISRYQDIAHSAVRYDKYSANCIGSSVGSLFVPCPSRQSQINHCPGFSISFTALDTIPRLSLAGSMVNLVEVFEYCVAVTVRPEALFLIFLDKVWLLCSKHSNETPVRQHDFASKIFALCAGIDCAHVHVPMWKLVHALGGLFFNTSITNHAHIRLANDCLPDSHCLWFLAYCPKRVPVQERCTKHPVRR